MNETNPNRRGFLATAGAGLLGATAGCASPRTIAQKVADIDQDDRADGSVYTDVYEQTIDSVTFLRVSGIENPYSDTPGQGQGSGFLYDETHVVTNEHVVYGGDEVDVRFTNGEWAETEVVGTDFYSDLAVLEVDTTPDDAEALPMAERLPVTGQEVLAIGNPFGLEGSMSQGIVSGVDRSLQMPGRSFSFPNVVQTDAGINPGNSGGPLVNLDGEVLGVINAGGGDNIGFAISSALTRRVVPPLIDNGEYHHSYMGISLNTVDPRIAEENDLPEANGVIVTTVDPNGPAGDVLQGSDDETRHNGETIPVGGDVILEMDGESIPDRHALSTFLALSTSPGDTVPIDLYRDGERETVELTLGARPTPEESRRGTPSL